MHRRAVSPKEIFMLSTLPVCRSAAHAPEVTGLKLYYTSPSGTTLGHTATYRRHSRRRSGSRTIDRVIYSGPRGTHISDPPTYQGPLATSQKLEIKK